MIMDWLKLIGMAYFSVFMKDLRFPMQGNQMVIFTFVHFFILLLID